MEKKKGDKTGLKVGAWVERKRRGPGSDKLELDKKT